MASIFISYSHRDANICQLVAGALKNRGYKIIVMGHPEYGLCIGENWESSLYAHLKNCVAVIAICSVNMVESKWCFAEITHAKALGKPIFPLKIDNCGEHPLLLHLQHAVYDNIEIASKALDASIKNTLGWRDTLKINPNHVPFPGLLYFDESDAPFFFGRDKEVRQVIEKLRIIWEFKETQSLILVGSSGSGKSSLLRAGLLPSLRNMTDFWIPARATLCDEFAFDNLLSSFTALRKEQFRIPMDFQSRSEAINALIKEILDHADNPRTKIIIALDQLENLITDKKTLNSESFLSIISIILKTFPRNLFLIGTLRSDYYADWNSKGLPAEIPTEILDISPMNPDQFSDVIFGPARLVDLEIDPLLTSTLISDTKSEDALPLLAFVLRELWEGEGKRTGKLTKQFYMEEFGGLARSVECRADAIVDTKVLSKPELEALRLSLLMLVREESEGKFVHTSVPWCAFPETSHRLLTMLIDARLLVSKVKDQEHYVGIVHEALYRQWSTFLEWLSSYGNDVRLVRQMESLAKSWRKEPSNPLYRQWPNEGLQLVYRSLRRLGLNSENLDEPLKSYLQPEHERLIDELTQLGTSQYRRSEIGDRLATIGDPRHGVGCDKNGVPQIAWCKVTSDKTRSESFCISKYPITYAQYLAFYNHPEGYYCNNWWTNLTSRIPGWSQYRIIGNHPVDSVSWIQAIAFCRWLSGQLGIDVTLPTESQWQLAATGRLPNRIFPWGQEPDTSYANTSESRLGRTIAVGMYPQNCSPVGVFDLTGNVFEHCINSFEKLTVELFMTEYNHAVRGGSFLNDMTSALSESRYSILTEECDYDIGFRIITSAIPHQKIQSKIHI
ncbi:MAG: SUMF1/EgtB/PvdO family nonheme iron enzyme [Bacteroidetes bacterium]|nr:SUMF1/EgtB/PvdO family nonheme iron enzyme [Bacteroidota bacterium]